MGYIIPGLCASNFHRDSVQHLFPDDSMFVCIDSCLSVSRCILIALNAVSLFFAYFAFCSFGFVVNGVISRASRGYM